MLKNLLTPLLSLIFFQLTLAQSPKIQVSDLLIEAEKAIDSSNYNKALEWAYQAKYLYPRQQKDTTAININNKLAEIHLLNRKIDSGYFYCNAALKLASSALKKTKAHAETLELLGRALSRKGNPKEALIHSNKALALKKELYPKNHRTIAFQYLLLGKNFNNLNEFDNAKSSLEAAKEILDQTKGELKLKQDLNFKVAHNYMDMSEHDLATKHITLFLDAVAQSEGLESDNAAKGYTLLASINSKQENFQKAIEYNQKAELIYNTLNLSNHPKVAPIYFNTANIYREITQFTKAINYYQKALINIKANYGEEHFNTARCYLMIGDVYRNMGKLEEGLNYLNKAKPIFIKTMGKDHIYLATINTSIASCYDYKIKAKEMIDAYKNAISIYTTHKFYRGIAYCNFSIANIYQRQENYQEAKAFFNKNLLLPYHNPNDEYFVEAHYHLAKCHIALNELDAAKQYLNKLAQLLNYKETVTPYQFDDIKNFNILTNYLHTKVLYYNHKLEDTKNKSYVDSIQITNEKFLKVQDYWDEHYSLTADKTWRLNSARRMYERCIKFYTEHKETQEIESAYKIAEITKNKQLNINFNALKATKFGAVPDSLIQKEQHLKLDIAKFEKLKFETKNDSLITSYGNQLFELKRQKDQLYENYRQNYPKYFQLKYGNEIIPIANIQKYLDDNQCLLNYYVGEEFIFIFTITKYGYDVIEVEKPEELEQWVKQFRYSIYKYEDGTQAQSYLNLAHKLYNTLIAPAKSKLKKKLTIIPDDVINYIPFEALLTQETKALENYKSLPYLIKEHQISYNYSTKMFNQLANDALISSAQKDLIAFAPTFKNNSTVYESLDAKRSGFEDLFHNIPEAEMVHNFIPGSIFKGASATEANFLKNAADYKIIHLSTHAKSNDRLGDYSFIALSKVNDSIEDQNRLYVRELYDMNLNADMVVLSACETGLGELQKGEGIISLARAFTYAGAKSTINSLWNVNDVSTKLLMEQFYKNIKDGKPKDQALHEAKLSYLEYEEMDAPFFWASFIAMGNMEPIALSSGFNYWWLLAIPLIFGILYFIRRKQ